MFQFTTTNVINSNKDFTTGKPLWSVGAASGSNPASLHVKRVNNFKANCVAAIYKAAANDAELAKVTFDLSLISGTLGDIYRLNIYLGLTLASQNSRYSNDLIFKGKPLSIDFEWKDSAANTVAALVKNINKYQTMIYSEKLLNVSYSGTFLTIEATTEYQRFRRVNIEQFNEAAYHGMGEYVPVRTLEDITNVVGSNAEVTNAAEGYFVGKEGFGTYSYLMHNLRLPTYARTRAFATNKDENPIIGAKYNQYTIIYCANRGILGNNAVGDIVKSLTTHVFFVKDDIAAEFETALGNIGTVIDATNGKAADPGTIAEDLGTLASQVKQLQAQVAAKQDTLSAGDGINIDANTVSVKVADDTLTADASGLKVTDGKFAEA